jgi:hypothetical protein
MKDKFFKGYEYWCPYFKKPEKPQVTIYLYRGGH